MLAAIKPTICGQAIGHGYAMRVTTIYPIAEISV
jgi:hypothetical protein